MHHNRADIDGLRAVAIVPVVLFHAGVSVFAGGFVGVDVFFVISGFLITGLIRHEVDTGRFSLAHFYKQRVRRLLPALFAMLLVATMFAAWLLLPADLADYAKSVLATSLFASNFRFWQEAGYFGRAAEERSLGRESLPASHGRDAAGLRRGCAAGIRPGQPGCERGRRHLDHRPA
jgi:peptidoglycan/LPS O-acetylase OafA/YrhL